MTKRLRKIIKICLPMSQASSASTNLHIKITNKRINILDGRATLILD